MRQQRIRWFWLFSLVCVVFGSQVGLVLSQDDDNEYVGTRECRSCHRSYANDHEETVHFQTLIEVEEAEDDDVILASFDDDSEAIRTIGDDASPFTQDDVIYTLGAGRHYQAYVTEVDGVLRVLPAQWQVAQETWVPLELAEEWSDPAYDFSSQCAGCHTTNFNAEELEWDETGVQCEACHGPGLNHVEIADDAGSSISNDEYADLSSAINFALDSQVCGQCHIRGTNAETGLPLPVNYHPGMDLLDESIFTPFPLDNGDAWFATGHAKLPNMQFNEWMQSSHPNALSSAQESENFDASCLGCHSAAQQRVNYLIDEGWVDEDEFDPLTTLEAHAFGVTCATCHNPHEIDNEHFLREEDTYELCISCHYNGEDNEGIHHPVKETFEGVQLIEEIEPVAGAHFTADEGPDCLTCHMQGIETKNGERASHAFYPVSPAGAADIENLQDACTICHTDIEDPLQMQSLIDSVQSNVTERVTLAQDTLADDSPEWVQQALAAIEGDGSRGIHNFAYTNTMLKAVESELGIVGGTIDDSTVSQQVAQSLPPSQVTPVPVREPVVPPVGGLRSPSMLILGIFGLITLVAAYSFFMRGGQDD